MIKKIKVTKLRPGMFVHDFNCSWFKHPFLRGKAKITDQRMIDKIVQHGIREVYIDTSKGLGVRESDLGKGLIREIQAQLSAARYGNQGSSPSAPQEELAPDEAHSETPEDEPVQAGSTHQAELEELPVAKAEAAPEAQATEPSPAEPEPQEPAQVEAPSEAPVEAQAEAPLEAQVEAQAEAPTEAQAGEPVEAPVEAPVEPQAEVPLEAQVEAQVEVPVEPQPGDNGQAPDAHGAPAATAPSPEIQAREAQAEDGKAHPSAPADAPPTPGDAHSTQGEAPSDGKEPAVPKPRRRLSPRVIFPEPRQAKRDNGRGAAAPPVQAEEEASSDGPSELAEDLGAGATMPKTAALDEEIQDAARIRSEAKQIVQKVLEDAKLGKQIQMEKVHPMVGRIVDSVLRNPDALLTLSTIKKADDFTYMHSLSVCVLMACFTSSFHLSRDKVIQAGIGALLHDVGKVKVPPEILHKAGKLTEEEEAKLRTHVEQGYNILSKSRNISPIVIEIATQHHEHHDGTGYPRGLKGDEVSIFGQASAVVNMYDILTSDRWWRKGMEPTEALSKLLGWSKFRFNEDVVHRFVRCIGIYPIGTLVRMESGLLAVVVEQGSKDLLHPVVRTIYDTKRQWFTKPRDLDLSYSMGKSLSDRIVCHESPDKWKIKPQAYLAGEMLENGSLSRRLRGVVLNA